MLDFDSSPSPRTTELLRTLETYFQNLGSALVCYSGGIDSALVLAVAHRTLGSERAIALTAVSPSLPDSEREGAERTARAIGATHHFVSSNELARPGYVQNGPDRCFHCKSELYEIAEAKRTEWGLAHLVNGTNADDLGDYRPGLMAAEQARVKSPLAELGCRKTDVRALARALDLEIWDKPAAACLSSRIPYGTQVTPERLAQIGSYEAELRALGFRQLRVRWHQEVARIELAPDELARAFDPDLRNAMVSAGKRLGFTFVTLDLAGYRQGSHNEALSRETLSRISLKVVS